MEIYKPALAEAERLEAPVIREIFRAARRLRSDLLYVKCVTPYPGTRIRAELLEAGLVTNPDDLSKYTGFICNVRTRFLTCRQLKPDRWRRHVDVLRQDLACCSALKGGATQAMEAM